jgi:LysM repeat protein
MPNEIPPCPSGIYWQVTPGDTLYMIASRAGTTVDVLFQLNPEIDPENLKIGQLICLPAEFIAEPIPPCPSGIYWIVAPGDTLWKIAREYGTTVERIMELNPGIEPENLRPGQNICLP